MEIDKAESLLHQLSQYLKDKWGYRLMFGVEVEFYLFNRNSSKPNQSKSNQINQNKDSSEQTISLSEKQLSKFSDLVGVILTKERGNGQYEFRTQPLGEIKSILDLTRGLINKIQSVALLYGWIADFRPKPLENDYGSALQIHTSLHQASSGFLTDNLYSIPQPEVAFTKNSLLTSSIAGTLSLINQSMYLLTNGADVAHLKRFVPGFMSPVNLSWGFNNRSTAIRVPGSSIEFRRFEFRVAGSGVDVSYVLLVIFTGVLFGLETNPQLINPTYGNADDDLYTDLERILTNPQLIYQQFTFLDLVQNIFKL